MTPLVAATRNALMGGDMLGARGNNWLNPRPKLDLAGKVWPQHACCGRCGTCVSRSCSCSRVVAFFVDDSSVQACICPCVCVLVLLLLLLA